MTKRIITSIVLVALLFCMTALNYSYAISVLDDEIVVSDELLTELRVSNQVAIIQNIEHYMKKIKQFALTIKSIPF